MLDPYPTGVSGFSTNGNGVYGYASGGSAYGVYGKSSNGYGIVARSDSGCALFTTNGGGPGTPFRIDASAEPTASIAIGAIYVNNQGELFIYARNAANTANAWRRVQFAT